MCLKRNGFRGRDCPHCASRKRKRTRRTYAVPKLLRISCGLFVFELFASSQQASANDWEQRKVGDYLVESRERGSSGDVAKKLTVKLWGKGVTEKAEISGSAHTQYYVRHAGQFIYSKLDFLNAAFGVIPDNLDEYESTADLPAFDVSNLDARFLLLKATQRSFYLRYGTIADGSRKAKRIHSEAFLAMPLFVPDYIEQTRIANLFARLDLLIALHQRERAGV